MGWDLYLLLRETNAIRKTDCTGERDSPAIPFPIAVSKKQPHSGGHKGLRYPRARAHTQREKEEEYGRRSWGQHYDSASAAPPNPRRPHRVVGEKGREVVVVRGGHCRRA
jgi:hypothetical protein